MDEKLFSIVDTEAEDFKKNHIITCSKGCSSCCEKTNFLWQDFEILFLIKGLNELDTETKEKINSKIKTILTQNIDIISHNLNDFVNSIKTECPFLISGGCSVYRNRPIICRMVFSNIDKTSCAKWTNPNLLDSFVEREKIKYHLEKMRNKRKIFSHPVVALRYDNKNFSFARLLF